MTLSLENWARNVRYSAGSVVAPRSIDELRQAVVGAARVKARGSGHSFNRIADTDGVLVSLEDMPRTIDIDRERRIVRVAGGLRYGDVAQVLDDAGFALPNLASLPHISVAGAVATGTHGSGDRVGPLSTAVASVELMNSTGELLTIRRGDPRFAGAVVSLGALGVVVSLELDVVDRFDVAQTVYESVDADAVVTDLDAVTGLAYSTSLFTTWRDPSRFDRVWLKQRVGTDGPAPDLLFGTARATRDVHPVPGMPSEPCTPQLGVAGAWVERLPHFLLAFTPSVGDELQSEYFVDRASAPAAIAALRDLAPRLAPLALVSEIRTMAPDEQWLSPTLGRDAVALHFTWRSDPAVLEFLPTLEAALADAHARPHWGKLSAWTAADVAAAYPHAGDFMRLRRELDPRGAFTSTYLEHLGLA